VAASAQELGWKEIVMDKSGYLLTKDPEVALELAGYEGVRYAARLEDGRGFAAFDTDHEGMYRLGTLGEVFIISEADPNDERTWPDWARQAPHKKFTSTLEDRFALYPVPPDYSSARDAFRHFVGLFDPKAAALVTTGPLGEFFIIVENGSGWDAPEGAVWDCGITEYHDVRVGPLVDA